MAWLRWIFTIVFYFATGDGPAAEVPRACSGRAGQLSSDNGAKHFSNHRDIAEQLRSIWGATPIQIALVFEVSENHLSSSSAQIFKAEIMNRMRDKSYRGLELKGWKPRARIKGQMMIIVEAYPNILAKFVHEEFSRAVEILRDVPADYNVFLIDTELADDSAPSD